MWQGAQDQLIRWRESIDYYRRVATFMGDGEANFAALQSWFRYYHAPGVGHCGGGVGRNPTTLLPNGNTQLFDDLVKWVEQGIPPVQRARPPTAASLRPAEAAIRRGRDRSARGRRQRSTMAREAPTLPRTSTAVATSTITRSRSAKCCVRPTSTKMKISSTWRTKISIPTPQCVARCRSRSMISSSRILWD